MEQVFKVIPEAEYSRITEKLDLILQTLKVPQEAAAGIGNWISEAEAQKITGKKATTLWKMRYKGFLAFTKFNNKIFYDRESIMKLLDANRQDAFRMNVPAQKQNNRKG